LALPARAAPGPRVVVEITPRAEQQIDPRLTRRLIALELGDIEVPPQPNEPHPRTYATVFFRVLVVSADSLRVELWERGEFYGARSVSGEGSRQIRARRLALGAAELVHRLRQRRLAEARHLAEEQRRLEREAAEREAWEQKPTIALGTGAVVAFIGPGDAWLAGPELAGELRLARGPRLDLGLRWLWGGAGEVNDSGVSWLEILLAPSYVLRVRPALDLSLGVQAGAAAVHLSRATAVDDVAGEHDTWSARAALFVHAEPRLASWARLIAGPELGAVLRAIPARDEAGEQQRLGGLWIGASVGLALDPAAKL
jgi:hypothetical protein